jgi:hypothetical protein
MFLALAPASAEEPVASPDEMQRAKATLAEALKQEQAAGREHGAAQTVAPPTSTPLEAASPPSMAPPTSETAAAPPVAPPADTAAAPAPAAPAETAAAPVEPPAETGALPPRTTAETATTPAPALSHVESPAATAAAAAERGEAKRAFGKVHQRAAAKRHPVLQAPKPVKAARVSDPAAKRRADSRSAAVGERTGAHQTKAGRPGPADEPLTTGSLPAKVSPFPAVSPPVAPSAPLALPASLAPPSLFAPNLVSTYREGLGFVRGTPEALRDYLRPGRRTRGAASKAVAACRQAIVPLAAARGATEIDAAPARAARARGALEASLRIRILYKRFTGYDLRQASVSCTLDPTGRVVALSASTIEGDRRP